MITSRKITTTLIKFSITNHLTPSMNTENNPTTKGSLDDHHEGNDATQYLKALTFGDSLTEGFYHNGLSFHPYAIELTRLINKQHPELEAIVHERGLSGEYTDHMIPRLAGMLDRAAKSQHPYHIVCVLAGTNDLASDDFPNEVFNRLKQMYEQVLAHGDGRTLLVTITIPPSAFVDEEYVARRSAINAMIKEYSSRAVAGMGQGRVVCVDAEQGLPYWISPGDKDAVLWDDALHLTPEGYDRLGGLVFSAIEPHLADLIVGETEESS